MNRAFQEDSAWTEPRTNGLKFYQPSKFGEVTGSVFSDYFSEHERKSHFQQSAGFFFLQLGAIFRTEESVSILFFR